MQMAGVSVNDRTVVTAHEEIKLVLTSFCWPVCLVPEGTMQASQGRGRVTNNLAHL